MRQLLPVMVIAVTLTGLSACKLFNNHSLISRAEYLSAHRQWRQADPIYRFVLERGGSTDTAAVKEALAKVCNAEGKYSDAEAFFEQSIAEQQARGIEPVETLRSLGQFYMDQGRYSLARPIFRRLVLIGNITWTSSGTALRTKDRAQSLSDLRNLAIAYRYTGQLERSAVTYRALTQRLQQNPSLRFAEDESIYADVLRELGKIDQSHAARSAAAEDLMRLAEINIHNEDGLRGVIKTYFDIGSVEGAAETADHFEKANQGRDLSAGEKSLIKDTEQLVREAGKGDPYSVDYFSTAGCRRWPVKAMPLKVSIQVKLGVRAFRRSFLRAVPQCLQQWVDATDGQLRYELVSDPSQADIVCTLTSSPPADLLHQAAMTSSQCSIEEMKYSQVRVFAIPGKTYAYLLGVCLHELGHALGITGHSSNSQDVMYFLGSGRSCVLSARDKATIKRLYVEPD